MAKENQEPDEQQSLFRSEAIEHFASTGQFEQSLQPMQYRRWMTRLSFALLLIGALTWLVFGSIPIETQGVGIAASSKGLSNVETSFSGVVKQIHVQAEEPVNQGDLLATLSNPEVEARLQVANEAITSIDNRLNLLKEQVFSEANAQTNALIQNIHSLQFKIQELEKDLPIIQADVKNKEDLAAKGLFDSQSLQQSKELLWNKQIELEKTRSDLSNSQFLLKKEYRQDEVETLNRQLLSALQDKNLLEAQLQYKNIYSPVTGIVQEWFIKPNQYVESGTLIARLELEDKGQEHKIFFGYLPIEAGKKVRLNAEVEITLTTVKSQEYGAILGNIVSVSQYAISPESLTRLVNNPALIDFFLQKHEAVLEVVIEPQLDPHTVSGYRWTSGEGSPIQLTSGTLCTFEGLVEEIQPILYFFPAWRLKQLIYRNPSSDNKN